MSGEHEHCPFCGDDMCDGRCYDALLDRLANAGIDLVAKDRRIDELEAIVAKLPHTADGVPVVPGQNVYASPFAGKVVACGFVAMRIYEIDCENVEWWGVVRDEDGGEWPARVDQCYSNHAAAEKASKV